MFAFRDFSWIPRVINFLFIVIVLPILFDMYCIVNFLSHCRHFCHIVGIFAIQSLLLPHSRHFCQESRHVCHHIFAIQPAFLPHSRVFFYIVGIFATSSSFCHIVGILPYSRHFCYTSSSFLSQSRHFCILFAFFRHSFGIFLPHIFAISPA